MALISLRGCAIFGQICAQLGAGVIRAKSHDKTRDQREAEVRFPAEAGVRSEASGVPWPAPRARRSRRDLLRFNPPHRMPDQRGGILQFQLFLDMAAMHIDRF
ncbi:MAG: hypothetical protein RIQ93_2689 [Verrucomicrobiota bacterium]